MKPKKKDNTEYIVYAIILVLIIFFSLHFSMAYEWAIKNPSFVTKYAGTELEYTEEKFNISGLFNRWGENISERPGNIKFNEYTAKILFVSVTMTLVVIAYILSTKKKYISGKEYGSSEWGEPSQLISLGWKKAKNTLIIQANKALKESKQLLKKDDTLTSFEKSRLIQKKENSTRNKIKNYNLTVNENTEIILAQNVKFSIFNQEINCNVLIYGGSGAGKSRGIVMPNIMNLAGTCSFVITDPKGEIYQKAKYFLKNIMGYKVRCINLFEKVKSAHYNPLHYIHIDRENYDWQEDVLTLIDTMIINLDGGEGRKGSDPFWDDASRHFIQSLFFFTMYMCEPQDRNMNQVMWLLGQLEIGEEEDNLDSPLDQLFELLREKWGEDNIAYRTFKDFRTKASGKTAKSIAMTMVSKLQPYNIASVQALSQNDEMMLDRIGEEKTAIFVIVPPVSKTFNFVAGMLFSQLFQELNYCANALHGGRLPVPVQFIMDEFANTCVIPNFEQIIAYARSLGIGIMPILQSRAQLKGMYEKAWETISDNCSSTVFLGSITSEDTLKAFSERLGKGTFDEKDVSVSKGRSSSTSISNKKIGRELMTPAEISAMPKSDCLVFISGKKPMYCKKYNYPNHRNYKYTSDFDDRYLTMFTEDNNDNIPNNEEVTAKEKIVELMKDIDLPVFNNNPEEVLEMVESTYLGSWTIEDNYDDFNKKELEDKVEDINISKREEIKNQSIYKSYIKNIDDLYLEFNNSIPKFTSNTEEIEKLADEFINSKEKVVIADDEYELDDDIEEADELINSLHDLSEDIAEVEMVRSINMSIEDFDYLNTDIE